MHPMSVTNRRFSKGSIFMQRGKNNSEINSSFQLETEGHDYLSDTGTLYSLFSSRAEMQNTEMGQLLQYRYLDK